MLHKQLTTNHNHSWSFFLTLSQNKAVQINWWNAYFTSYILHVKKILQCCFFSNIVQPQRLIIHVILYSLIDTRHLNTPDFHRDPCTVPWGNNYCVGEKTLTMVKKVPGSPPGGLIWAETHPPSKVGGQTNKQTGEDITVMAVVAINLKTNRLIDNENNVQLQADGCSNFISPIHSLVYSSCCQFIDFCSMSSSELMCHRSFSIVFLSQWDCRGRADSHHHLLHQSSTTPPSLHHSTQPRLSLLSVLLCSDAQFSRRSGQLTLRAAPPWPLSPSFQLSGLFFFLMKHTLSRSLQALDRNHISYNWKDSLCFVLNSSISGSSGLNSNHNRSMIKYGTRWRWRLGLQLMVFIVH